MLSVVVDTNVLVSGLLGSRTARQVLRVLRDGKFKLVTSSMLVEEFLRVAASPPLSSYISSREARAIHWFFQTQAQWVTPRRRISACRDPKDNIFLEVAAAADADAIVTGDRDLLVLNPYQGIQIVSPSEFLRGLQ